MPYNPNDFKKNGFIEKLPISVSYNANLTSRAQSIFNYKSENKSQDRATLDDGKTMRFDFGTLKPWTSLANLEKAMDKWEHLAPVNFSPTASTTPLMTVSVVENLASYHIDPVTKLGIWKPNSGVAYSFDSNSDGVYERVDILLDKNSVKTAELGSFGFQTILHELGHALGLDHPFETSWYNFNNTIMSYTSGDQVDGSFRSAITPMLYDMKYVQETAYIPRAYNSTNTEYSFAATNAENKLTGNSYAWTIWDTGGIDVLDASKVPYNDPVTLDLRGGVDKNGKPIFSYIGKEIVAIGFDSRNASGVVDIENAIGGSGNDTIIGGYIDNVLTGGVGNDKIIGLNGKDTFIAGDAKDSDVYVGFKEDSVYKIENDSRFTADDNKEDTLDYSKATYGVKIDLTQKAGTVTKITGAGVDTLYGIERIIGTAKADTLIYNPDATGNTNKITFFDGGAGIDIADFSKAGKAVKVSLDGSPADIQLKNVEKVLNGSEFSDNITGGSGANELAGGSGEDILDGGLDNDILIGGENNDIYKFTGVFGNDMVNDSGKGDTLFIDGNLVAGSATSPGYVGPSGDGTFSLDQYTLIKTGTTMKIVSGANSITLTDWRNGDYGITLQYASPLVVDLQKNGLKLSSVTSSLNGYFDIDGDGMSERTGWIEPEEGFLVVDKNNNGMIDNVTEMFGDEGGSTAWTKFKVFDSNKDNKIDSKDTNWAKLKVWRDLDRDLWTDSGELFTLQSQGIAGFNTAKGDYQAGPSSTTGYNLIDGRGTWIDTAGKTGYYYDVFFDTIQEYTKYVGSDLKASQNIDLDIFRDYPVIGARGSVKPLYISIQQDASLKSLTDSFRTLNWSMQSSQLDEQLSNYLSKWAEKENIVSGSRGSYVDAKKVTTMEAFIGMDKPAPNTVQEDWYSWGPGEALTYAQASEFKDSYEKFLDDRKGELLIQTMYEKIFPSAYYSFPSYRIIVDDSIGNIVNRAKSYAPADAVNKNFFWSGIYNAIKYVGSVTIPDVFTTAGNIQIAMKELLPGVVIAENYQWIPDNASFEGSEYRDNYLLSRDGPSTIHGGLESDYLVGNGGNDTLYGYGTGVSGDTLLGGDGNDSIRSASDESYADGGAGNDNITLWKTSKSYGGSGDDFFYTYVKPSNSVFDGGTGTDTIEFYESNLVIDLAKGTITHADTPSVTDKITSVEKILLDNGGTVIGSANAETIIVNAWVSNSKIAGGGGADIITGGKADSFFGNGADIFDFNALTDSTKAASDRITNFDTNYDRIELKGLGFTGIVSGASTGTKLGFTYDSAADKTIVTAVADFKIVLDGHLSLDASDFIFV